MALDLTMLEAEFQSIILQYCDIRNVLAYHTHDSRRSNPGYPDLTLVGDRGQLYAELKKEDGVLSEDQKMWIGALTASGQNVQVWRPSQWESLCIPQINALGRCSELVRAKGVKAERKARAMLARRNARLDR